jgi:hypothetical protein
MPPSLFEAGWQRMCLLWFKEENTSSSHKTSASISIIGTGVLKPDSLV